MEYDESFVEAKNLYSRVQTFTKKILMIIVLLTISLIFIWYYAFSSKKYFSLPFYYRKWLISKRTICVEWSDNRKDKDVKIVWSVDYVCYSSIYNITIEIVEFELEYYIQLTLLALKKINVFIQINMCGAVLLRKFEQWNLQNSK